MSVIVWSRRLVSGRKKRVIVRLEERGNGVTTAAAAAAVACWKEDKTTRYRRDTYTCSPSHTSSSHPPRNRGISPETDRDQRRATGIGARSARNRDGDLVRGVCHRHHRPLLRPFTSRGHGDDYGFCKGMEREKARACDHS